jgi:hypothetical protein
LAIPAAVSSGLAQTIFFPENDTGANEIGIQGRFDHPPGVACDPPLGRAGGSFGIAWVGDGVGGASDNAYTVLSYDTSGWPDGAAYVLFVDEFTPRLGNPFVDLGRVRIEFLTSDVQFPSRFVNPDEVEGAGYELIDALAAGGLFSTGGIDLTDTVNAILGGPHARFLYLRFRFTICTDADGVSDQVRFMAGPSEPRRTRIVIPAVDVDTTPASAGQAVDVTAAVAGFPLESGDVFFRPAGSTGSFEAAAMTVEGETLAGSIPADRVTARGLGYYVEIRSSSVTIRVPSTAPATPDYLPVAFANERLSPLPSPGTYVMTGLPFVPDDGDAAAVLVDDLGSYDVRRWRFGRFDPATEAYVEFPGTPEFAPGRGFWLVMRNPVAIGAAGHSTDPFEGTSIAVEPGWNQIAHPYLFPVDRALVDFSGAPSVENRFVGFVDGGYADQDILAPWSGYWVFNAGVASEVIHVPGVESAGASAQRARGFTAGGPGRFAIEVALRQGEGYDRWNVAGVTEDACEGLDAFDRREPPPPPGQASAYFLREEGGSVIHRLTADILPPSSEGRTWLLAVDALLPEMPATVTFSGVESAPAAFEAVLFLGQSGDELDLRSAEGGLAIPPATSARYRLAVGTPAYIDGVRDSQPLPATFALGRPAPNPTRGTVSLRYTLPEPADVRFCIYDVGGRLVRMLVDERLGAGRHVITWSGTDAAGRRVPPGVFFGKIEAGVHRASARLFVIR